ncbi:hypothetical protein K439DRAFT_1648899 [Ramaria rubella]|nr:hypothetical protein K439DRAFT_1648899 [Ramaria rubella]
MRRAMKACMKSHHIRIPKYNFPIRLRPWFLLFTSLIMVLLAFLGFTNFVQQLPLNDRCAYSLDSSSSYFVKILHFLCLGIATGVFYFIWDVDEDARRIWIWRNSGLILTGVVCFFFGGIVSEIVQSMLPYKQFDIWDVIANLSGSALGLWVSYHLERYYRHRREISRLYRPLSAEEDGLLSDSDSELGIDNRSTRGVPLLPTHRPSKSAASKTPNHIRLGDVWDESEELFEIGEDEDEEHVDRRSDDTLRPPQADGVKATATSPN